MNTSENGQARKLEYFFKNSKESEWEILKIPNSEYKIRSFSNRKILCSKSND